MKLRSNRVFKRGEPKINSHVKNQSFLNERRLSLRSSKSYCGNCDENLEMGVKESINVDDKGLFFGSEVLDPMEDLVVSCPKEEIDNESMSISLSETGVGFKEEKKSPHVECENGSRSLESETFVADTTIDNGGDDDQETSLNDTENCNLLGECKELKEKGRRGRKKKKVGNFKEIEKREKIDVVIDVVNSDDQETSLNDTGNRNLLGECKEMKEKGRRGRKKKKGGNFKEIESNQEKIDDVIDGVNGDDGECMVMPLKCKTGKKRKNAGGSGYECNGEAKHEKVEKDGVRFIDWDGEFRVVVLGLKRPDDVSNQMLKPLERKAKTCENLRPKKKLKRCVQPCKLQGTVNGMTVVLGLKPSDDIPNKMPKRRGRPRKVQTKGENMRPKKKLKMHGKPCKLQGEITSLPLNDIPKKKQERRGRPRKVPQEIPAIEQKLQGKGTILKKFKRRGRPPKMGARTLAAHVIKRRTGKLMSVKKSPKICKNLKSEENSELVNAGKGIIGSNMARKQLKQLIRDKISDVLLKCGWTVDLRQRQEKSYNDAVYIEPKGKRSHWSITAAYANLKKKIENGDADNDEMSAFTPIPEEEISLLFRQRDKERKKKKNKKLKVKKGKTVTPRKKKHVKKSKDGSKRKIIFKPRVLAHGSKQDNEGILIIKKRNLLSWMIDSGVILAGTKVQYGKTRRQKRSSEGVITSDGICCGCCNETMGITKFVGHCGGKFGQVFDDLYLESGACLRQCLMDSWRKEEESDINRFNVVDIQGDDPNDDTCNICGDGGNLICCDGCPSTFHQSCLDVENFPSGDWNCIYCTCKFCGVVSISTPQAEDSHDEVTSQMLSCCLCEEKFHQLCVQEVEDANKDSNGLPFCGRKCQEVFERLQMHIGVKHELEDGFSWTLLQRSVVDQDFNAHDAQLKIEGNSKLAIAFSVMDECFIPIVDERSGTNIIRNVVYNCGSNFRRLNYAGFLTAVLEKDDEFITAASIRIHGYRLAEMPFIGTRHNYRRQGMCRRLLDAIEATLSSLGVKELIIPAIPALLQTWTDVFGFTPLEDTRKHAMKCMSMMVFPGIAMLKKPLLQNQSADVNHSPSAAVVEKNDTDQEQKEETINDTDQEQKEETILLMDGCSSPKPNDENTLQVETTSSNATDYKQTSPDITAVEKDVTDYKQTEKETVVMDCCSCPDLENNKSTISHNVNSLCDLNLPVKNVLPCDTDGQTSVDSECTIEPSSLESVVCGNLESSEVKLDIEDDGVPGVEVNPSPLTSELVLKNTFDLNLQPTAVETDAHIISDDSVQCESRACIKSFELSDSRSQVDQSAGGQNDCKTCESQPLVIR